jgi:TetR/AcrR family transcriptional repressor of nem operon
LNQLVQNLIFAEVMARTVEFIPEEKIAKALEVFWCKGYNAASLSELTEAMKLNKSSLYNSFKDKHNLFIEALKAYSKIVENDYWNAIKGCDRPIEKLDSIIDTIASISVERDDSCLGIKTSFEMASHDKKISELIKIGNDKTIALIRSLIDEAQFEDQIRADRDANTMSHFIFNSFSGLRQSYIIHKNKKLVRDMASELKAFLRA